MVSKVYRCRDAAAVIASMLAGLAFFSASSTPSRATESYIIPASDGYGISDCMHSGNDCGRVIADSWCESHGHAHVLAFGTVEDVTGAVQPASSKSVPAASAAAGDIVIRCGD